MQTFDGLPISHVRGKISGSFEMDGGDPIGFGDEVLILVRARITKTEVSGATDIVRVNVMTGEEAAIIPKGDPARDALSRRYLTEPIEAPALRVVNK